MTPTTTTVPAAHPWPTNAHLIADIATSTLPWLNPDDDVIDVTYGAEGGFWKQWRPHNLVTHDLKIDGVDYRHLPHPDASFDVLVLDGDYKLSGTPSSGEMDARYGTDRADPPAVIHGRIIDGITEAARVLRPRGRLLLKCQDQVNSGRKWWQTRIFADHAEQVGFRLADTFLLLGTARPQPMEETPTRKPRTQRHAHGHPSALLVFVLEHKAAQLDLLAG